jgi:hypothetical protein
MSQKKFDAVVLAAHVSGHECQVASQVIRALQSTPGVADLDAEWQAEIDRLGKEIGGEEG